MTDINTCGQLQSQLGNDMRRLVRAAVLAYAELNAIRARDVVPYTSRGFKSDVDEEYFSSVVDMLDEAVKSATGVSAHCHPFLLLEDDDGLSATNEIMCDITGCKDAAVHSVKWGSLQQQEGKFCETHLGDLWDQCRSLVAVGKCYWIQGGVIRPQS